MAREKICGIYKIENLVNGKVYIGSSIDIKERWRRHKKDLRKNKHHSDYLQRSWNKYGESNFSFEIIEYINDNSLLQQKEQHYIDKYNAYKEGYNAHEFVDRHELSQETKDKIGKSSKGRNIGEKSNTCKITEEKAKEIINDLLNSELCLWEIRDKHNITDNILHNIYQHRAWNYLTDNIVFPKHNTRRPHSKLNDNIVKNIINDILNGVNNKTITEKYNISIHIINNIKQKHSWKHLTHDVEFYTHSTTVNLCL